MATEEVSRCVVELTFNFVGTATEVVPSADFCQIFVIKMKKNSDF